MPPPADPIITLINGDTISAGGQAAIVSGTTVALAANDALVVNGKTSPDETVRRIAPLSIYSVPDRR